jgi:AhpD family alkylhydroperoxidase
MARIQALDPGTVQGKAKELLDTIKAKSGRISNIMKTMAHSPTALQAYLGLKGAFDDAKLPLKVREQIALAVGEDNQCHYCVAAHSAIGKHAGLTLEEIEAGRRAGSHFPSKNSKVNGASPGNLQAEENGGQGRSPDPKTNAILRFAKKLSANRGNITDPELEQAREAGCSDEEILEIIAAVSLNLFTNYINHVADTAIDFPQAPLLQ